MYLKMLRGTRYERDYCQRQETVTTEDICKLSEQSKTDSQGCLQLEAQISDTMNNNNTFGQCKYNSDTLQDIPTKSSAIGGLFSRYKLQQCRLCTVQYPIRMLTSILENQRANRYLKLLEMCLPVKMDKNDGLPHYICYSCFLKLEQCYETLDKFRKAYNKHREKIKLTDKQSQIDTIPIDIVTDSSETKSSESNNNDIDIQNDNKIEPNLQYISPLCPKLLSAQNDLTSILRKRLLFGSKRNIKKPANTYVKNTGEKNNKIQWRTNDENIQNNRQLFDVVVGSTDSENDGQVNHFSAETNSRECKSVNTDTADVCSVKSAETTLNDIKVSDNDTLMSTADISVSGLRLKKINELTYNAESNKYQVQHRDNSTTFTVKIVTKENTSSAAQLSTNNDKTFSANKIKLMYECSFCHKWLTSKKKLIEHCIAIHNTSKDEKITCRQLKTIVTGNGKEPCLLLNDENIRMDNTEDDTKDSTNHKYQYECGQCSKQLTTKEDLISHCVANKCFNAQNQIVCKQVKLKSMPTEVRYQCNRCDASFTEPRARIIHTLECHSKKTTAKNSYEIEPGEIRYQCKQCNASFAEYRAREIHTLTYHSKYNKTKDSNKVAPKDELAEHRAREIPTLAYYSKYSKTKDSNKVEPKDELAEHRAREIPTLTYYSKYSKTKDSNKVERKDELKTPKTKDSNKVEPKDKLKTPKNPVGQDVISSTSRNSNSSCLCMYCGVIRRKYKLIPHERIHTNERPYQCAVCPKTFRTAAAHAKHKEIHDNQKNYICHRCGRGFNTQTRLSAHMKTHLPMAERPFVCEVCGKRFGRNDHYKRHKAGHTEIVAGQVSPNEYKCLICHKLFNSEARLKVHIRRAHVNNVKYNCHECGKTFKTKYKFTIHRYLHTGEKPFKCNFCDKMFRCRATQHQHMLVHKSDAPHMCDICGKRFKRPGHLKIHKQRHSTVKPYICNVCGKAFQQQQGLINHQKRHTGVKLKTKVV